MRPTRAVVAAPFPLARAPSGERKPLSFARCAGDAGQRPASRPQAAKTRPRRGNLKRRRRRDVRARSCRRATPLATAPSGERKPWSFARCAGDAGQRPALHCRAPFGRIVGTRFRGPRTPRNPHAAIHARHPPAHHHNAPPRQSRAAAERRSPTGIAAAGRETRPRRGNLKRRRRRDVRARRCRRAVPLGEGAIRQKEALEFRPLRGRCRSETGAPLPCALRGGLS